MLRVMLAAGTALAVSGCVMTPDTLAEPPAGLWVLEDLNGRGVVDDARVTATFDGVGRVYGSGGCNRYSATYTSDDGTRDESVVKVGPVAATKRGCPEPLMNQEQAFFEALSGVHTLRMDDGWLYIESVDGSDVLKLVAESPSESTPENG